MNILIVEDDAVTLGLMKRLFESEGATVFSAENESQGLICLGVDPPMDLVVLDLNLPDVAGENWLRLVQQQAKWVAIPVVVLTASADAEIDVFSRAFPGVPAWRKPVSVENLKKLVHISPVAIGS